MSCSVNLLPEQRLHYLARLRRRNAWLAVSLASALLLAAGWAVQGGARATIRRVANSVQALHARRVRLEAQETALAQRRAGLYQRLRVVADARRFQPWPEHLTVLANRAPDGVFLTSLVVSPVASTGGVGASGAQPGSAGALPAGPAGHDSTRRTGAAVPIAAAGPGRPGSLTAAGKARPGSSAGDRQAAASAGGVSPGAAQAQSPTGSAGQQSLREPGEVPIRAVQLQGYAASHAALLEFLNLLQDLHGWQAPALVRATLEKFPAGEAVQFEIASRVTEEPP